MHFGGLLLLLAATITPPSQPATGPGGADYKHEVVIHQTGNSGISYWIYEPANPAPTNAPVIIFLHGWSAIYPRSYAYWLKHLARRGNLVIYPRYQKSLLTRPRDFTSNSVAAVQAALTELQSGKHVRPDVNRVAVIGHSMGGAIAINLAATPGLPTPKAVMCVAPGDGQDRSAFLYFLKTDWSQIPATTLLLTLVGDEDKNTGHRYAQLIDAGTPQIPATNKNYIIVHSDRHGRPALIANHDAPEATTVWPASVDALDYYAYWKLFDALIDAAFVGTNREFALGNTLSQF